jgi:lysophospholipase L1-like esterase
MAALDGRAISRRSVLVAVAGDSISAGSPLWDPDAAVRTRIPAPDERSQWQWWAAQAEPRLAFRTTAVYGERTDEIARRLELVLDGAELLVVQGGINDVVQQRPVEEAVRDLEAMAARGLAAGCVVAVADVLPWPAGDARAAEAIARLNELIHAIAGVIHLPFHDTLARSGIAWSDDGDHPSVEGHRLLGEAAARLLLAG